MNDKQILFRAIVIGFALFGLVAFIQHILGVFESQPQSAPTSTISMAAFSAYQQDVAKEFEAENCRMENYTVMLNACHAGKPIPQYEPCTY